MSAQSGQLILLSDEANVTYECNSVLHVGSEKNATNVCLSGLKNVAFSIYIDTFGRVCINVLMKRIQINGKRVPKNAVRPLVNNTAIEAGEYKFIWKYDSKCSRSYSLSPCKRSERDVDMFIRNRKTINSFTIGTLNDENTAIIDAKREADNDQKSEPMPAIKGDFPENVKHSTNKRTSLIPVKPNRTSELRRSMVRSKSVSHEPIPFQCRTPKRPVPSATMAKSVNAIIRSESHSSNNQTLQATRKSLGANMNFSKIIDGMNLFNVVTNEMKAVGPSKYNAKFSATNSPKRTPKKALIKPKRLSLRSELTEMAIMRTNAMDAAISSEDQKQLEVNATLQSTPETLPSTPDEIVEFISTPEGDAKLESSSEACATLTSTPEADASFTSTSEANTTFTTTPEADSTTKSSSEANATLTSTPEANTTFTSTTEAGEAGGTTKSSSEANATLTSTPAAGEAGGTIKSSSEANATPTSTPEAGGTTKSSSEANATFTSTPEAGEEGGTIKSSSEANATPTSTPEGDASYTDTPDTNDTLPNTPQAEIVDLNTSQPMEKESTNISSVERDDTAPINTPVRHTENINTPEPKQKCLPSRLTSSSSVELIEDSVEFCLIADEDTDDESSDSEFSIISVDDDSEVIESETSPEVIASTLTRMKSESFVIDESITTEAGCEDINQLEESQVNASPEDSSEKSVSESRLSSVSTPTKVLPIRARRNSRLCSLDECCSSSTAFTTPTKSKLLNNVASTPRSILKTPKAAKTPKKSVRILETILHEDDEDVPITNSQSTDAPTSVTDQSVQHQNDIETEPLQLSVDANVSMDECDEVFTPINNKTGSTKSLNGKFAMESDSEIILPAETNISTPSSQPNKVFVGTPMAVQKLELIETPVEVVTATVIDTPIFSAEAKLSDDATDVIDKSANVSGQRNDLVDQLNETEVDSTNTTTNKREKTNLFDETFEIQSDCENESQDISPVPSTSVTDENVHVNNVKGVQDVLKTPKPLDKTNLVGMKELLLTPSDGPSLPDDMRGIRELLNTPKPLDKTNLVGMKELLLTPSDGPSLPDDMRGIRELLNTPKPLDKTNLVGMKELLQTPSDESSGLDDMRGVKELLNTPKPLDKTNLVGMKELLKSPDSLNESVDMRGVRDLLKTPKMLDKTNFIGVKELLKTPHNQDDSHLEGVRDLLESPIEPVEQNQSNQPDDKKFCLNLRYNSRNSLINLVNNHMLVVGLPIVTDEELLPVAPMAEHAPVDPMEEPAPVEPIEAPVPVKPMGAPAPVKPMEAPAPVEPMGAPAPVEVIVVQPAVKPIEAQPAGEPIGLQATVEPIALQAEVEPITARVALEPEAIPVQQEESLMSDVELKEEAINDSKALQSENDQSLKEEVSQPVPKPQSLSNDDIVEEVEAKVEPTVTTAKATNKKVSEIGEGKSTESNKPAHPKTESNNTKTLRKAPNCQASAIELQESQEEIVSENDDKALTAKPSKATRSVKSKVEPKVSKTPSRTRKRRGSVVEPHDEKVSENDEVTEATAPKPVVLKVESKVSKTPARTRKGKTSVAEPLDSQDEKVSESDEASEATKPVKLKAETEAKTTKTPSKTRKRKASVVRVPESQDEKVSESDEASQATKSVNSKAEPKTTKTPSRTRKRKASVTEVQESHDEKVSESDEAAEATKPEAKVVQARKRKATVSVSSHASEAGPSTAESEVRKTRRRKVDQVEPEKAENENAEIEPSNIPKNTRKRQASAVEQPESNEHVGTKVARTRKRNASSSEKSQSTEVTRTAASSSSEFKHPRKRQRRASDIDHLESRDENVSEASQAAEAADSEPSNVESTARKARKRIVRQEPPSMTTRSTRSSDPSVEPVLGVMGKPTRATSKRTRQMSESVPNDNTESSPEKRTKVVAPKTKKGDLPDVPAAATMNKPVKVTRSRKASEAETANTSQESTSSTATRTTRRGQAIKAAAPVAEKRPKRGTK